MKATIYLHIMSGNLRILLENGEVWYLSVVTNRWKRSKHYPIDIGSKPWTYTKLSTVNNFKMLHKLL